jgi:hypothetical protein
MYYWLLFTGIALKIYLNERPFEPRERDYALVGSFYVFAIWIGFGVYALYESAQKYLATKVGPIIIVASILAVPCLWRPKTDDHDRSGKYTATAMAKAYLNSCPQCHSIHNRRQRHVSTMVRKK